MSVLYKNDSGVYWLKLWYFNNLQYVLVERCHKMYFNAYSRYTFNRFAFNFWWYLSDSATPWSESREQRLSDIRNADASAAVFALTKELLKHVIVCCMFQHYL